MVDKEAGPSMEDAAGFFANVFGGERFFEYVRFILPSVLNSLPKNSQIGEISLMKEMTNIANTVMTEEEKAAMERDLKGDNPSPAVTAGRSTPEAHAAGARGEGSSVSPQPNQQVSESEIKELKERRKRKLTPEQRQKLDALEKERIEAREKRVKELEDKLVERYVYSIFIYSPLY